MKHRQSLLVALALGGVLAYLMVGSARAGTPERWTPGIEDTWQYQLDGPVDVTIDADIFDLDLDTTSRAEIAELHVRGRRVLCYIDAGSWEPYRRDADAFPASVKGKRVDGWPDERWLDIRQLHVLLPIMRARLDRCAAKGFDGVEFDWIDGHRHDTGFPLTRRQQLRYDRRLARAAHARGLAVAQKNAPGLVPDLVDTWDMAVVEECFQYRECGRHRAYTDAGKPVLVVEYALPRSAFCERAEVLGVAAIRKRLRLDAWRAAC